MAETHCCAWGQPELVTPLVLVGTGTSRAMDNSTVKTLLQLKEIKEAMDPTAGTCGQPAAPKALTQPAAISSSW